MKSLDPDLVDVCEYLLREVCDISIVYTHRGKALQDKLFAEKKSKLRWPNSKHNSHPSMAVDIDVYPRPSNDVKHRQALSYVAGRAIEYAKQKGITLRWGGDWDRDGDLADNSFDDLFHLEKVDG